MIWGGPTEYPPAVALFADDDRGRTDDDADADDDSGNHDCAGKERVGAVGDGDDCIRSGLVFFVLRIQSRLTAHAFAVRRFGVEMAADSVA